MNKHSSRQLLALVMVLAASTSCWAVEPEWVGQGKYRFLITVAPRDLKGRQSDEMPADIDLDLRAELKKADIDATPDLCSMQVIAYDPETGKPMPYEKYAYAKSNCDRPFRWYDAAIPYEFPEYEDNLNNTDGQYGSWTSRVRWGYFYDCVGDWQKGRLAWVHTQQGNSPSYYAMYFDLLQPGQMPQESPPRGFIGDGMNRCVPGTCHSTGQIHSRIDVDDFNGDGLLDLIVGCSRGGMIWYPNIGTAKEPKFRYAKMLFTTDGKPIDIGWSSTPRIVDWDGDGVKDIISGVEWNRIAWFKNVGSNADRRFVYKGLVKTDDGKPLTLPFAPCPEGLGPDGSQIYQRDYYPVLDIVDWNGDGQSDLLAGGYVTGRIFYYENTGKNADGTPILHYVGPLEADGKPIDVDWCAAPCAFDCDGDGDLDLITGTMKTTPGGGDSSSSEQFLQYYENVGSRAKPILKEKRLPREGQFPNSSLGTPRACDINSDGLTDLVVSAGTQIYIFLNVGSGANPVFRASSEPIILGTWGNESLDVFQFLDWNHDGLPDAVSGWKVGLNTGKGNPGIFEKGVSVVATDQNIDLHLAHKGDDWQFPRLYDLDGDGKVDLMNADHGGHIWFHRNTRTSEAPKFDPDGVMLKLADGTPIKVGPQPGQAWDFDVLQGARANYAVADFNNDGKNDLVIGDAFRFVHYYENVGEVGKPVFAPGVQVTRGVTITAPAFGDWNGDGLLDIIIGNRVDAFDVCLNTGKGGKDRFASPQTIPFAGAPAGAVQAMCVTDFNGDGDQDVITETYYGFYLWLDRSFIDHGYAKARLIKLERR